ncbi:TetR family transcriptional regulator [Pontibacillus halophilus JSM 076056 = DSM 19796]|uniref:TetR family transcriptional regulator n=1 Tax=Pontibacillus halophilus JSM 076056 = DSM 19796 TaxID=1385510 RepID=A0A0A5GRS0_9BACI|nr:TetR/AcrR family transcriptional regulator [Pontibacillus halophilus]KGX93860.1 TetR family transcriptional regulator [Pontibacillus halophilus JSM 076056 = DSM 19796]
MTRPRHVPSSIKDEQLVTIRRNQMIKAAVKLFKEKGFHKTTTREVAKEAGFSIGTLYEYIRKKEDILFLVCDYIYERVMERLHVMIDTESGSQEELVRGVTSYFQLMDDMQDEVVIMYQEVKSLSRQAQEYVLQKEGAMIALFEQLLEKCTTGLRKEEIHLLANNITVQGQMWGFRRWMLQKTFTIDSYAKLQTQYLLQGANLFHEGGQSSGTVRI